VDVDQLLEPLIAAVNLSVGQWTGADMVVRTVSHEALPRTFADITAVVGFVSGMEGALALCFPQRTAAALAGRILTGVTETLDDALIRDCVGEMVNVLAGQAKGLLAGTPGHFTFGTPTVLTGTAPESLTPYGRSCLAIVFDSELGELALQLYRKTALESSSERGGRQA